MHSPRAAARCSAWRTQPDLLFSEHAARYLAADPPAVSFAAIRGCIGRTPANLPATRSSARRMRANLPEGCDCAADPRATLAAFKRAPAEFLYAARRRFFGL
jgi:hypothetical protein